MKRLILVLSLAMLAAPASAEQVTIYANGQPVSTSTPFPVQPAFQGAPAAANNPVPIQPSIGNTAVSGTNPIPVQTTAPASVAQANITSICQAPVASSTAISLTAASSTIDIYTSSDCSIIHVNWTNGTATTSNAAIYPGGTYRYQGTALSAFKVIGEGTSGTFSIIAK